MMILSIRSTCHFKYRPPKKKPAIPISHCTFFSLSFKRSRSHRRFLSSNPAIHHSQLHFPKLHTSNTLSNTPFEFFLFADKKKTEISNAIQQTTIHHRPSHIFESSPCTDKRPNIKTLHLSSFLSSVLLPSR